MCVCTCVCVCVCVYICVRVLMIAIKQEVKRVNPVVERTVAGLYDNLSHMSDLFFHFSFFLPFFLLSFLSFFLSIFLSFYLSFGLGGLCDSAATSTVTPLPTDPNPSHVGQQIIFQWSQSTHVS